MQEPFSFVHISSIFGKDTNVRIPFDFEWAFVTGGSDVLTAL